MPSATPLVATVMRCGEMPQPPLSVSMESAFSTLSRLCMGSPMPMKTTLRAGPTLARRVIAWVTISPAVKLRTSPSTPEAQKAQRIAQPTWLDRHKEAAWAPVAMRTHSTVSPSDSPSSSFVESAEANAESGSSGPTVNSPASAARSAAGRSVISSKLQARRPWAHANTWSARKRECPRSVSQAASSARDML